MRPPSGIKVVEIGQNLTGPFAGEIPARTGADVIGVERPSIRRRPPGLGEHRDEIMSGRAANARAATETGP